MQEDNNMDINSLKIKDLQPSQFYISKKKIEEIKKWFNPNDLSNFEPIPIKEIDDEYVVVDGHTRLVVAIMANLDSVPLCYEEEEWDWEMYRECIKEAKKRDIKSPYDLLKYIISEEEYKIKWDKWCDNMQESINNKRIQTNRLYLRNWRKEDAPFMFKYCSDDYVGPICGWPPHKTIEETKAVLNQFVKRPNCYAICLKDESAPIGCIELMSDTDMSDNPKEYELGYWIGRPYWGNGYMTEAANALIDYAFKELELEAIWCGYYEGNNKSKRVQEKLGFLPHHKSDVEVKLLNETRIGYANLMTKERWQELRNNSKNN